MGSIKPYLLSFTLSICFLATRAQPLSENQVFEPNTVMEAELAKMPVDHLKSNLEKGDMHLLRDRFTNKVTADMFLNRFQMLEQIKIVPGCFKRHLLEFEIGPAVPIDNIIMPDHEIPMEVTMPGETGMITVVCTTTFNTNTEQYLISEIVVIGDIPGLDCPELPPPPPPPPPPTPPDISESICALNPNDQFSFIKLRNRESSTDPANQASILGGNTNAENILIPDDFGNSVAFRQILFPSITYTSTVTVDQVIMVNVINPLYEACRLFFSDNICSIVKGIAEFILEPLTVQVAVDNTITYQPGYVISGSDRAYNNLPGLFRNVSDADGVLQVPDLGGSFVSLTTGYFLDRQFKRITALSNNNDIVFFGRSPSTYQFDDPVSLTVAGKFVYVLDKGSSNNIVVMRHRVNASNELELIFVGTTTFGQDLMFASDIATFENTGENILYIANPGNSSIIRVILDKNTGLQKNGAHAPFAITKAVNFNGEKRDIGPIVKIESSLRNSSTGQNVILATVGQDQLLALSTNALSSNPTASINFKYTFPSGSGIINMGYNLGNTTFYVTDHYKHKIHIFSHDGEYIGSGGAFGQAENANELFNPNTISSNTFTTSTNEMVVGNTWATNTGFKKIKPLADIGSICVIEKAPISYVDVNLDALNFQFSLTSGEGVDQVTLDLNGQNIKTLTSSNTTFRPNVYANNFLANATILQGKLNVGWNTYTVTLDAQITVGGNTMNYQRTKSIDFYYILSSFDQDFLIDNVTSADLFHNDTDDPFVVYKNVWVSGDDAGPSINFTIQNGKTQILTGCRLTINKPTTFRSDNEYYELTCGSNIRLIMENGTTKRIADCTFDGTNSMHPTDVMVTCMGDFTGSTTQNSAHTSNLEIISTPFIKYVGAALHLVEGRATLANCTFQPYFTTSFAATGIRVSPTARVDMLGGGCLNNDIGIDANTADVFIGTNSGNYKGSSLTKTMFTNNKIALHTASTSSKIVSTDFKNNDAAVMQLSGNLDIQNMSGNLFQDNTQAIIFSDGLESDGGKNHFVNNGTDITYIMPDPISLSSPVMFNLECNLWQHGSTIDQPIFDVRSDPPPYDPSSGLVTFDYTPYLEYMNATTLTCTGGGNGNGNGGGNKTSINQSKTAYHNTYNEISYLIAQNDFESSFTELTNAIEDNYSMTLEKYPKRNDTVQSYREAMLKNMLYSYISVVSARDTNANAADVLHTNGFINLVQNSGSYQRSLYEQVREDRLEFLEFFLYDNNSSANYEEQSYEILNLEETSTTIELIPNPATEHATIIVTLSEAGNYSLELFNIMGQRVKTLLRNERINEGKQEFDLATQDMKSGLYYVSLRNSNGQFTQNKKLLIVK